MEPKNKTEKGADEQDLTLFETLERQPVTHVLIPSF